MLYDFDPNRLRRYPGPILARLTDGWLSWVAFQNHWSDTGERLHQIHGTPTSTFPVAYTTT